MICGRATLWRSESDSAAPPGRVWSGAAGYQGFARPHPWLQSEAPLGPYEQEGEGKKAGSRPGMLAPVGAMTLDIESSLPGRARPGWANGNQFKRIMHGAVQSLR